MDELDLCDVCGASWRCEHREPAPRSISPLQRYIDKAAQKFSADQTKAYYARKKLMWDAEMNAFLNPPEPVAMEDVKWCTPDIGDFIPMLDAVDDAIKEWIEYRSLDVTWEPILEHIEPRISAAVDVDDWAKCARAPPIC